MPQKRISLRPLNKRVNLKVAAGPLASSDKAVLLHEDGYQPVLYLPMTDIPDELLTPSDTRTHCPHKGDARYFDLPEWNRSHHWSRSTATNSRHTKYP